MVASIPLSMAQFAALVPRPRTHLVRYHRLTGEDEDATHRTLSHYLDLISSTIEPRGGQVPTSDTARNTRQQS